MDSIAVVTLSYHSFAGQERKPGDAYTVKGDSYQTADQYFDTLQAIGHVKAADVQPPAASAPVETTTPVDSKPAADEKTAAKPPKRGSPTK